MWVLALFLYFVVCNYLLLEWSKATPGLCLGVVTSFSCEVAVAILVNHGGCCFCGHYIDVAMYLQVTARM